MGAAGIKNQLEKLWTFFNKLETNGQRLSSINPLNHFYWIKTA
jgi:hypothetical protein